MSTPPPSCAGEIRSSSTAAARATVTTGSMVDNVDASAGPRRAMPAKKVVMATTVDTRAMAPTAAQLPALEGNDGRSATTITPYTAAAATMITAEDGSAPRRGVSRLPTRM